MNVMSENIKIIERVRKHYVDKLGREVGALSAYARDLGVDPRLVHWWKNNDRPIPGYHGLATERATGGKVTEAEIILNEVQFRAKRKQERSERWRAGKAA